MDEKISVIIPVYNSERYLGMCIDSILGQTYSNLQIILVDDGSTDGSPRLCDEYGGKDARIIIVHQVNKGVSAARNTGLKIATGEVVSFVDSDDVLEKDMFSFLIGIQHQYQSEIVHCGYKRADEKGNIVKEVSGTHQILVQDSVDAIDCMLSGRYFVGGLWNKLFKKSVITGISFDETLKNNEDILFNVMAFQKANSIAFADETKYIYYEHTESSCNTLSLKNKLMDSVLAAERMVSEATKEEALSTLQRHLFNCRLILYRYMVLEDIDDVCGVGRIEVKNCLRREYEKMNGIHLRSKFNYYFLCSVPVLYKGVYRIYDKLRKPRWDAKEA